MDESNQRTNRLPCWSQWGLFLLCAFPLVWLCTRAYNSDLGANPVEEIIHETGIWALRFLLLTLAVTPFTRQVRKAAWLGMRRMFGLFAFFYALLHLASYLILDQWLDWRAIMEDILERPYITVGMTALVLMLPLAMTSTAGWRRRLQTGWVKLHRLVYVVAILAVLHFWWQVKADVLEPFWYAAILAMLLVYRVYQRWRFTRVIAFNND